MTRAQIEDFPTGVVLAVLLVDAVVLAVVELLFLPLRWDGTAFPIVALLAALTTPWLVRRADELGGSGWVPAAPLVVWVAAILVFGTAGPGGDVLLPSDWRSALLVSAGMFPAAVTLGRALGRPLAQARREAAQAAEPLRTGSRPAGENSDVRKGKHRG